jgi:hypothetical protein
MAGGQGRPRKINNLKGIERQLYALKPARLCFKPHKKKWSQAKSAIRFSRLHEN